VLWWALLGAICLAFEIFVMTKWVTGPSFKQVPSGPSVPPTWMKVVLITGQIAAPLGALLMLYRTLVRPWIRERLVATDGLMCLMFLALMFYDPLENYFAPYVTYNSYMVNFGSWVTSVPGWSSFGRPGATVAEPIIFQPANYVVAPLLAVMGGCWMMRMLKARWPGIGDMRLVAMLFATMLVCWPLVEGGLYMPLGFFTFAGGSFSLFPQAYHKYPLQQALFATVFLSLFTSLRYFKNDEGHTIVERGIDRLRVGVKRKALLRFLALVAIGNVFYVVGYDGPLALWTHATTGAWPADVQSRSYLTDYLCGDGTNRICPQPVGTTTPRVIPFASGKRGPFTGPLLGESK
jgi:hypothetical protein